MHTIQVESRPSGKLYVCVNSDAEYPDSADDAGAVAIRVHREILAQLAEAWGIETELVESDDPAE